jgi:hypothetical protein
MNTLAPFNATPPEREAAFRRSLSLLEKLPVLLAQPGMTARLAAQQLGVTEGYVSKINTVHKLLSENDRKLLYEGKLGIAEAYNRARGVPERPRSRRRRVAEAASIVLAPGLRVLLAAGTSAPIVSVKLGLQRLLTRIDRWQADGVTAINGGFFGLDEPKAEGSSS